MAGVLRHTRVLLGSGGGLSPSTKRSNGGNEKRQHSWYSPRAFARRYGGHYSKPHKARDKTYYAYMTKNTSSYHQLEEREYIKLGFVEHIDLREDMGQLVERGQKLVPKRCKVEYEKWKVENIDEVQQHAGRYAIATWTLDPATGSGGSGGIIKSYSPAEMRASTVELTNATWIDYIQPGYGTEARVEEDDAKWNSKAFDDIDGIKEWINLEDRTSWLKAPNSTPVSRIITPNSQSPPPMAPALPRPALEKFLTFNSEYGYGTEQFSPWFQSRSGSRNDRCEESFYHPSHRFMYLGVARQFIPDTKFMSDPATRRHRRRFSWLKEVNKKMGIPTKVHPSGREAWITPFNWLTKLVYRRTDIRVGYKSLMNINSMSSCTSDYLNVNNKRYQKYRKYKWVPASKKNSA